VKYLILPLFFFQICISSFSQISFSVTGLVVDENNTPLIGANIYLPELQKGTISDSIGRFALSGLPAGILSLSVSFISYETAIFALDADHLDSAIVVILKPSPIQGKAVVVSGGRNSSQHENAIKIDAIDRKELSSTGTSTLIESITQLPGVAMISRGGGVVTPVIRGLSTSNILFLNNGVRMENFQFSENHPYLVDEFGVNQVEVIKGPASLLYGSDAIGGVINSIPENPSSEGQFEGDAGVQYFSNTSGLSGTLGMKSQLEKFTWGLRGSVKSHEDYLDGNKHFVPNTRFNGNSLIVFSSYRLNRAMFRAYYEYQSMKAGLCNEESILLVTARDRKNKVWYQDLDNHLISLKNTIFLTHYRLLINASYQLNNRKLIGSERGAGNELVDMRLQTLNMDVRNVFAKTKRAQYTIAIQGMLQNNMNADAPNRVLPDYTLCDLALFGMGKFEFGNFIHFQIGLRFDNRFILVPEQEKSSHSHEVEEDPGHDEETMEEFEKYYGNLSGSAGFTWEIAKDLLLRANLASAYRSPNIAEHTQDGEHGIRYEQGDRDLKPQRNYELDLSMHYHMNKVLLDISGFYNSISDYIFLDHTSDTTDEGHQIFRYNQNNALIYGSELIIEVLPFRSLDIKGTYSFLRGKQNNNENLPFIPHNKISAELKWEKSLSGVLTGYYIKFGVDHAFRQDKPSYFETTSPEYTILNAGLGLSCLLGKQNIELDFVANNFLDRVYIDHLSTLKDLGYNNMGRNLTITLRVPFGIDLH
jgi:iron complex outermembrane recepter protein